MKRFALLSAVGVFGILAASQVNAATTAKVTLQASVIEGGLTLMIANNPSLGKIAINDGTDWSVDTKCGNKHNVDTFGGCHNGELRVKSIMPDVTYTIDFKGGNSLLNRDNIGGNGFIYTWIDSNGGSAGIPGASTNLVMDGNEATHEVFMKVVGSNSTGTYDKYDATGYVTLQATL